MIPSPPSPRYSKLSEVILRIFSPPPFLYCYFLLYSVLGVYDNTILGMFRIMTTITVIVIAHNNIILMV